MTQQQAQEKFLPSINAYGQNYDKKTEILARPAHAGEAIQTVTSDGQETVNTAKEGDYVVQNMTAAKEQYILSPDKIAKRYKKIADVGNGWIKFKATGSVKGIQYKGANFDLPPEIQFMASWNEPMALKDGDMIVTPDGKEVYRIARKEFGETYA